MPAEILADARTIAVVGASPKPDRPSHGVMRYLLEQGYTVHSGPACEAATRCWASPACARSRRSRGRSTSWTFSGDRRPVPTSRGRRCDAGARSLWLQLGIVSPEARRIAEAAGLDYVENECTKIVHARGLS